MVGVCAVIGCKKNPRKITDECYVRSDSEGSEDEESLVKRLEPRTFHRFPVNTELKKMWLIEIDRVDWNITNSARICSDHFKECDINRIANKSIKRRSHNAMLKPGAVPTRFKTGKRKVIHRTVMLKENPHPIADFQSQDSPPAASDLTYFDTASPSKEITSPITENEIERNEMLDQSRRLINGLINSNEIEIEPANIKAEIDPYFISVEEEIREEVSEANPNHNTMMNEIIMLNEKLREALLKISSYEKKSKEKNEKFENEKLILEAKLSKSKKTINFNEKKLKFTIDSYKKKMVLKDKKIIQLQRNNKFSLKNKEILKSKNYDMKMLKQSNSRLVKTREKLRKIISELKNKPLVKKIDLEKSKLDLNYDTSDFEVCSDEAEHHTSEIVEKLKNKPLVKKKIMEKNKLDLIYGTKDFEVCSDGAQHHTFEIVERLKNNKMEIIWRKKEIVSSEDGNGSAEDVFDRKIKDGSISVDTDLTQTTIPKDVVRNLQEDVIVTKAKEKIKENFNDRNEDSYLQSKNENNINYNIKDLFCELEVSSNNTDKGNLYISSKITKNDSIHTKGLPILEIGIPSIENSYLNDESKICDKNDGLYNFHVEDKAEEQPKQIQTKWIYQCNYCDKCLSSKDDLLRHQIIHSNSKPYECSHCSKCFSRKTSLVQHLRLHTGEKPYKCTHCSKSFSQIPSLYRHTKKLHGAMPYKIYACNICEIMFTKKVSLEKHKLIHTGEKLYNCSHCGKCFSSNDTLVSHKRIHSKPYECSHCGKCFSRNTALVQHLRLHTGEKPYTCSHCSKSFAQLNNLIRHKKMHTGEKPYTCDICEKKFSRKDCLEEHKFNLHWRKSMNK